MKRILYILFLVLIIPSYGEHRISWYTMDGGGGTSTGGSYQLTSTIGQPDADFLNGGRYELLGGFLVGGPVCIVNLSNFAVLAAHWMESPCNEANNWCDGADLDKLGDVDIADLVLIADYWFDICPASWPQ